MRLHVLQGCEYYIFSKNLTSVSLCVLLLLHIGDSIVASLRMDHDGGIDEKAPIEHTSTCSSTASECD